MIKAEELRIGNWVKYGKHLNIVCSLQSPKPLKDTRFADKWVVEINPPDIFDVTIDELKPIPLTEEWLERFGFKKGSEKGLSLNHYYKQLELLNWEYKCTPNMTRDGFIVHHGFMSDWSELTEIKHVHSLQNLYFALTNTELNDQTTED